MINQCFQLACILYKFITQYGFVCPDHWGECLVAGGFCILCSFRVILSLEAFITRFTNFCIVRTNCTTLNLLHWLLNLNLWQIWLWVSPLLNHLHIFFIREQLSVVWLMVSSAKLLVYIISWWHHSIPLKLSLNISRVV